MGAGRIPQLRILLHIVRIGLRDVRTVDHQQHGPAFDPIAQMGPNLDNTALERGGNLRITILAIRDLPGQSEILLRTAVIDQTRFHPGGCFVRSRDALGLRRRGGI